MNNNIIRTSALIAAAAFALASCLQMEPAHEETVGYLSAPQFDVDVTVENLTSTKAEDYGIVDPKESDIRFIVKDKDSKVVYDQKGLWTSPLVLPVGAYTVEASAGENGFGIPYFTGSATGTVGALDAEVPALSLSLANALVKVSIDENFALHFTGQKILMDEGAYEASFDEWFYVPAGSDLTLTLVGTNSVENTKEFTDTLSSPAAKTAYSVVYKQSSTNWPEISWSSSTLDAGAFEGGLFFTPPSASNMSAETAAKIVYQIKGGSYLDWVDVEVADVQGYKHISGLENGTSYSLRSRVGNIVSETLTFSPVSFQSCLSVGAISAAHNNSGNANVELSSTAMTASSLKVNLPEIVAKIASVTASGSFSSSNNAATGSFSGVALSATAKNVSFNNASGWPYLPQGTYSATVSAICSLHDSEYTASSTANVAVPAPVFSLMMTSYTSYDKYAATNNITKDVSAANSFDATTLYNAGGKWGIATNLMGNPNYAKTLVIKIDDDSSRTFNVKDEYSDNKYYENISGLSWASHNLTVSFTFDGVTVNKSQIHNITGLPYVKNFTSDSNTDGWTFVEKSYDNSYSKDYSSGTGYILYYAYTRDYGCNMFSPAFYAPSSIEVNYTANFYAGTTLHAAKTYTVYADVTDGTTVVSNTSTSIKEKTYCSSSGFNSAQISANSAISNQSRICISHNADLGRNQASQHYLYFGSLNVLYR